MRILARIPLKSIAFSLGMILVLISAFGFVLPCAGQNQPDKAAQAPEKDRGQVMAQLTEVREALNKDAKNPELTFRLASLCYQVGEFEKQGPSSSPCSTLRSRPTTFYS